MAVDDLPLDPTLLHLFRAKSDEGMLKEVEPGGIMPEDFLWCTRICPFQAIIEDSHLWVADNVESTLNVISMWQGASVSQLHEQRHPTVPFGT